ncbi:MAG: hypothetical protein ACD_77C00017G0003 [uncultured bacterium]|nr:MAG: hypothetical protein ACD_77C00017G0003 [uncultured bacterium]
MPGPAATIRKLIQQDVFDYQTLIATLHNYASPRDKISRLVHSGDIVRIKKGLYIFGEELRKRPISKMYLANLLHGPSYVSLEYALHHYSLIPEQVTEITSVTPGRSKAYQTPIGNFSYRHIPLPCFVSGMDIIDEVGVSCLIAAPEKALVDKIQTGPQLRTRKDMYLYLLEDLRINPSDLAQMKLKKVTEYCKIYGSSKSALFLQVIKQLQQKRR